MTIHQKFEILDHPADLKLRAFGKDLKEVFVNMALAMVQCLKKKINAKKFIEREIKVSSVNKETLLIDFLSEILYLSNVNKEVYPKVEIGRFNEKQLDAKLYGVKVEGFDLEIKAVTYGEEELKQTADGWEAVVVFDI